MKTKITLFLLAFFMFLSTIHSQTNSNKTFDAGSYIIDMGKNATVAKGLKPYGLVYTLIRDKNVPVYWSINSSKGKDGIDFSVGSKAYTGGTFIIAAEDAASLGVLIATWRSNGAVIDGPIAAPFTAPIFNKLTSWPRALLDTENGNLITPYYLNAGIPSSSYVVQSNPTLLTSCGDIYVLPHADPQNWSSAYVNALRNYMDNGGYLWVGCHAVSALDLVSAGNTTPFNFLTDKGLERWDNHNKPKIIGTYNPSANADPVMQFIGKMDASLQNGSERIYLPKTESLWRSSTKIAIYQDNYSDSGKNYTFPENPAVLVAYGPTYGDITKGMVMYQAAHEYTGGTTESMIAAQRAFFNFVLLAGIKQQITVTLDNSFPTALTPGQTYPLLATVTGNQGAVTYEWSAIGGGTFSNPSTNPTTYTAPAVIGNIALRLKVTDACGRSNFVSAFMNGGSIVSCAAEAVQPSTPTFKDNCGNDIQFTGLTVQEPVSSSICNTTKTYTWSYVDFTTCSPSATPYTRSWSYTYTIKDLVAPVISAAGPDITINCPTTPVFTPPTATDTCGIYTINILSTTQTPGSRTGLYSTTRTWNASDNCGNHSNSVSQTITVQDNVAPGIPVLADVTGQCSATPTPPTTTDVCAGTITGSTTTVFPITNQGTTIVTWTFDDGNGNITSANQNVIIKDNLKPAIPVLADVTGQCSATPTPPTTTDLCVGTIAGTTTTVFPITTQGTTIVTWTFDDGNGNTSTANQNVIIKDNVVPNVPVLADVTGQCSATPTPPTTTDLCAGTITGTTTTVFPITTQGTTIVTWTFDDGNGNIITANQNIIIKDNLKPAIPVLADVTGQCSATPTPPTTTDLCAGTITGTTTTVFPITTQGTTIVTWTFDDGNGNITTANQNVIIKDNLKPAIPVLADVTGQCSATPTPPTTTDLCVGTIAGTTTTVFPITTQGTTIVTWTFDDGNGNIITANQNIIIKDNVAPNAPVLADVTGQCSATPTPPTTTDVCAGTITGSTTTVFPITNQGTTIVTWTFDDGNGNTSTANQNVIIKDNLKPAIPVLADVTGQCSATPTPPTTTDLCAGTITGTTTTV
ncbi:PKD domain-containing protein, partial [Flavobacterium sp. W20_MBD1_R3]|uniref:PKD domain-containing protein n=1 Tax=Flavobacterium sp. W20_MBD1_R3 TaxID=3240278 RepID=UPI003F8E66D1